MSNVDEAQSDTPELRAALSEAAEFLLPLAQQSADQGQWSREVAGWLCMVRDSFAQRDASEAH